jgi:hypothetical protein
MDRPLFIPLHREWFDAFARGEKTEEWRRYGPRWNERQCTPGRAVTLSLGYSGARLSARIVDVELRYPETPAQVAFFGPDAECIVLSLTDIKPA